tara:strand:+ start:1106 stop:1276 length:171 start_codon:yes stop_codon:yes gene_type:complete
MVTGGERKKKTAVESSLPVRGAVGGISQSFWDQVASQVELNYDLAEKLAPIMLNIK